MAVETGAGNPEWRARTPWGPLEITINCAKPEKDPRDIAEAAARQGQGAQPGGASCPLCADDARRIAQLASQCPLDGTDQDSKALTDGTRRNLKAPVAKSSYDSNGLAGAPDTASGEDDLRDLEGAQAAAKRRAGASSCSNLPAWSPGQHAPIATVRLGGERWNLHFSTYAYCTEHLIVTSRAHRPMRVDRAHMACLLDFVRQFPMYFLGSNADLPIVGGSLLAHDHFQGGRHVFPLMKAPVALPFQLPDAPAVHAAVVRWPLSVIRLQGAHAAALLDTAEKIFACWRGWNDAAAGIVSRSADGTPHNTVTPIAYRIQDAYVFDLALRCNITSAAHPLGVFHPHEERHHIKKENIGLIEVMGRAILPGRLKSELEAVASALAAGDGRELERDPLCEPHAAWAREVEARHDFAREDVGAVLRSEVGTVFAQVLADCGVFKENAAGRAAWRRFLDGLGAIY
jgi:UDPglucose--hexose-1-phosphate uridylyltransferase